MNIKFLQNWANYNGSFLYFIAVSIIENGTMFADFDRFQLLFIYENSV
ncbi:hypothetical protein HRF87_14490 [Bacillus sp. CRN 9]|nr:hypothetical protein [Bacillus sp. CRN 9]